MGMRAKPADFQKLNLRCHALLSDVPLHDVWAIPLRGGGPDRSILDARAVLFGEWRPNIAVRGLFALRWGLGRAFGWDDRRHDPPRLSYVHRLTETDRSQSRVVPGTREGPFRILYVLGDEALSEIRNATVHAFLGLALTPSPRGYTLYMAVYVKRVSRFTALYMALIDPFRRLVVYPALGRRAQQRWSHKYAYAPQTGDPSGRWVAYAAAVWALVFAVFHIVWAAGWYPLLNAEQARIGFATPWKWAFDVLVAVMCVIAVPVALAPVMPWGKHVPRRLIYMLACIGSSLLILRAAASLLQTAYLVAVGRFRFAVFGVWEPWFYLGAVLFGVSTWRLRRSGATTNL